MRSTSRLILLLLLIGLCGGLQPVQAQQPERSIVFFHTVDDDPEPQGDVLRLRLFFMLKDRQGKTLNDALDQLGRLAILDANAQQVFSGEVAVAKPQTPLNIALVLDSSGSMNQRIQVAGGETQTIMDAAKSAARQAIEEAPQQSEFAIFQFAQQSRLLHADQNFLRKDGQQPLIDDAINAIQPNAAGSGNTCLSDAALQAIAHLNEHVTAPEARKVVILFTDGRDKEGNGSPANGNDCSPAGEQEVINQARLSANTTIPIYVVGPCSDADCSNIDRGQLERLAQETLTAPAAIGPREDILGLFKQIMANINSQWMVEANVLARQGSNTAALTVRLGNEEIPASIQFDSPRDYSAPASVRVKQDAYNPETEAYSFELEIQNPQQLAELTVEVYDSAQGGKRINQQEYTYLSPSATQRFELSSEGLAIGKDYFVRISGKNQVGATVAVPILTASGEVQPTHEFVHDPGLNLEIADAEYSADGAELVLTVRTTNFGKRDWRSLIEAVEVRDVAANDPELVEPLQPITDVLRIMTPVMMRDARQDRPFSFSLKLGRDGQGITVVPHEEQFRRPEGLSFLRRLGRTFANPLVLLGLALVLAGGVFATWYLRRPKQREIPRPFTMPGYTRLINQPPDGAGQAAARQPAPSTPSATGRPGPADPATPATTTSNTAPQARAATVEPLPPLGEMAAQTVFASPVLDQQPITVDLPGATTQVALPTWCVVVRVVQTNDPSQQRTVDMRSFPFSIGRTGTALQISGDPKVSREHLGVELRENGPVFFDKGSANGSYLGTTRLSSNEAQPLRVRTQIRLGPNTIVELDPIKESEPHA